MKHDNLSFYERETEQKSVSIIGVPIELGSDERGLSEAPRYLLDNGLRAMLTSLGTEISSVQMVPCRNPERVVSAGSAKYIDEIVAAARVAHVLVEKAAKRGDIVIALGGDHSISLGTIAGAAAAHSSLGVIWIDAHPDVNTVGTTLSGNVHGMPAAALMGFGHPFLTGIGGNAPKVQPEHFLYIGIKDMDAAEIEFLRREKVQTITMLDIAQRGLSHATLAIDALCRKVDTVWISMDMDSIDKAYAPGVGMPTSGGFTAREILNLAKYIGKTCKLAGLDVVEIVPAKDKRGKTAVLALELIARFLGGEHGWYENYMENYQRTNVTREEDMQPVRRNEEGV